MNGDSNPIEGVTHGRLFLPSLFLSRFATQPHGLIAGLLLIDIGQTFGYPVGVTGQLSTASFIIGVIFALVTGVLSVRYKHKSLLIMGLVFFTISALGCFSAPSFAFMLLSYSFSGLGMALVPPMCNTLVGEHLPLEKRSSAIGWILAGGASSYLIGAPLIGVLAGYGGWRLAFIGYMLPICIASLAIAVIGVPSATSVVQPVVSRPDYLEGFKKIFSNRSSFTCLLGTILAMAAWEANLIYGASFFRERFIMPTSWVSVLLSVMALCFLIGSLASGYLINRFGRKNFTVLSTVILGMLSFTYLNLHLFWLSMIIVLLVCVFAGVRYAASDSLTLEQVPEFRGTMMSVSSAAANLGSSLGGAIGGLSLLSYGYNGLGVSLGVLGISSAVIYHLFVLDLTGK
jgi:predicted MFS family arabinose efflux permease